MKELRGRVAVVTGAASGIGRALADRFAEEGMTVVLADIAAEPLSAATDELRQRGAEALGVVTDVADSTAMASLAREAEERYGGVDLVCLNAGVLGPTDVPIWEVDPQDWQWVYGINLWGVLNGLRAFVPSLLARPEGHVTITASLAGLITGAAEGPYVTSKHAVVALAEILERQLADTSVGVTLLCPWWVQTDILATVKDRPESGDGPLPSHQFLRDTGVLPQAVADLTIDAIRERRFYVHTDPALAKMLLDLRHQAILGP